MNKSKIISLLGFKLLLLAVITSFVLTAAGRKKSHQAVIIPRKKKKVQTMKRVKLPKERQFITRWKQQVK